MVVKPNSFSFSAAFLASSATLQKRALICPFFYIEIKVLQANLYFWHFQYGQRIRQEFAHPEFVDFGVVAIFLQRLLHQLF
jgi:hypothetical protein